MTDIKIFVDRIADMQIAQMNLVLAAAGQEVIRSHAPGENDLYVRTLEPVQVQESDFSAAQCCYFNSRVLWPNADLL